MSPRNQRYVMYSDDAAERRAALGATLILAAVLLAPLWPLVLAALGTLTTAWLTGLHPARVFRAAAWSAPMAAHTWLPPRCKTGPGGPVPSSRSPTGGTPTSCSSTPTRPPRC